MRNRRGRDRGRGRGRKGKLILKKPVSTTSSSTSTSSVRRSSRSLDRLLPGFIHQFRTPLGAMSSLLETLLNQKMPNAGARELELLMRSVRRLQQNVQAMLSYSKGEMPTFTTGSLNDPMQALIDYLEPICRDRQMTLERKLAAKLDPVRFQPQLLQEAVLNYAMNGIEAMKSGGSLTLETGVDSRERAYIRITDTGSGMKKPPKRLYHTTKKTGVGLGLYFARRVLSQHHARVEFASMPGKGTTVSIYFPTVPEDLFNAS